MVGKFTEKKKKTTKKKEVKEDFLYIFLSVLKVHKVFLVMITWRKYLFPYRTQKSSSNVPKIFVGYPAEKIGCCQIFFVLHYFYIIYLRKQKLEVIKNYYL